MSDPEILDALNKLSNKIDRMWEEINTIRYSMGNYLGKNVVMTYMANDNPIFVNSNDFGGPMNLLDGGEYEPDNLTVLLSFVGPETVFLDIGANLGFFSLVIGDRMRRSGKVIAFEPQPDMGALFQRSIYHNGLSNIIQWHGVGLSDRPGAFPLWTPRDHKGGATLGVPGGAGFPGRDEIIVQTVRLDDYLPPDFTCDLVKIDVEGHELHVLRGMREIVRRSPDLKILVEKLGIDTGLEEEMIAYFEEAGMAVHAVVGAGLSEPLSRAEFKAFGGYVLAARPEQVEVRDRRRFSIHATQLQGGSSHMRDGRLRAAGAGLLFHGPYWRLPRGIWRVRVHGEVQGVVTVSVAERFGYEVAARGLDPNDPVIDFIIERDLIRFECVFRGDDSASVSIDYLEWTRVG